MRILLTNDDGYKADGLNYLNKYFQEKGHTVFVVAPDSEKSGFSHSITLKENIRQIRQFENFWVIKGTPVDCVTLSLLGIVPDKFDVVVSGVNHGQNMGKDIIYSGTVGAARQGGLYGIPSMAISMLYYEGKFDFENVGIFLDSYFEKLIAKNDGSFIYNVNFPNPFKHEIKGVKKTVPCLHHYYRDELLSKDIPDFGKYYWIKGNNAIFEKDEGTDAGAVKNGFISVSPIKILPESYDIDLGF